MKLIEKFKDININNYYFYEGTNSIMKGDEITQDLTGKIVGPIEMPDFQKYKSKFEEAVEYLAENKIDFTFEINGGSI